MIKPVGLFLVACALLGCMSNNKVTPTSLVSIPQWVVDAQVAGFVTAVGFAPAHQGVFGSQQHRVAEMAAMRAFSQNQRVQVSNTSTAVNVNGQQVDANSQTRLTAANPMDFSKMTRLQTWVNPENQDLYVLFGIPE
jgi:hypothetical protein